MATWYDIKLATLQKMFAADSKIITDESTLGYIAAMPYAANEALEMISTAGKYLIKSVTFVHNPVRNLIPDSISMITHQILSGEKTFSTEGAKAYYIEVSGIGSMDISVDGVLVETVLVDSKTLFTEYRGFIDNPNGLHVDITLRTNYPMACRNVAMYDVTYPMVEDIPAFTDKVHYYMPDIAEDFYALDVQGIYYTGSYSEYLQTSLFYQEGDKTLVLPYDKTGSYTVYYKAYPPTITNETEDEYELPLAPEVISLMPLYMASQLYKDDDNGIATSYRNEFEVAYERLRNYANRSNHKEFTSIYGWV